MNDHVFRRVISACSSMLLVAAFAAPATAVEADAVKVAEGKALFERKFEPLNPAQGRGDGLGPVYNLDSCAGCHAQGGLGGSGPADLNAVTLSVQKAKKGFGSKMDPKKLAPMIKQIHPGLVEGDEIKGNVTLHRFGTSQDYEPLRAALAGPPIPLLMSPEQRLEFQRALAIESVRDIESQQPVRVTLSQRNTTALFGAGLIDQIPRAAIAELVRTQQHEGRVSGRMGLESRGATGRFGWRGHIDRLHDFVLGACANELGLDVPETPQPMDPTRPKYRAVALDLSADQCASLTAFVASLPAPKFVAPLEAEKLELVENGREVFRSVGCADCHVERIGPIEGIYSDLLLHNLGPALADPVLPESQFVRSEPFPITPPGNGIRSQSARRGYNGSSQFVISELTIAELSQEWRTPPLWGLADSAPYLHDGRAASVVEAIALHGGEAESCKKVYFALPVADRMAMLEFLSCLQAP